MSLVLDASLTLTWYFDDESTPVTDALLDQVAGAGAVVPTVWRLEVANALQMAIRRKRISEVFRDDALSRLLAMPITVDAETDAHVWTTALRLSARFGLTLYDAAYVELAQRCSLPLASLDQEMRAAASALNIKVLGSAS